MRRLIWLYCIFLLCIVSLSTCFHIEESISLTPLGNNLLNVKIKLGVHGRGYNKFLPLNILKILSYTKSLKINLKRGVYRDHFNNRYLDTYPFGFSLVAELKEATINQANAVNKEKKEKNEFESDELIWYKQLFNDVWDITGISTNLLKKKDLIKVENKIFAFLPDESVCTENLTLFKKLYPCGNFGGMFNAILPSFFITKYSGNIGFELNDANENHLVLYIDFITEHDYSKDIRIIDLLNSNYHINECSLVNTTSLFVKKKKEDFVGIVYEKVSNINVVYEVVNLQKILQNDDFHYLEEFINVNVLKEEVNSMITADIKKKQSSILYVFQNFNKTHHSDFTFIDKIPYYLSPLLSTLMIQGKYIKGSEPNATNKEQCNFVYFGYQAIKKFHVKFSNLDMLNTYSNHGYYYYINFKHKLPPQCEILIRFEVIKIQIRAFEFDFDIDRGLMLGSGVFIQKRNHLYHDEKSELYKYSSSLLVDIPLPDTSMPFNVMAISSCVIMLFFGYIFKRTAKEETRYI